MKIDFAALGNAKYRGSVAGRRLAWQAEPDREVTGAVECPGLDDGRCIESTEAWDRRKASGA